MSADTFCPYCGTNTNPAFSDHREETCEKNPHHEIQSLSEAEHLSECEPEQASSGEPESNGAGGEQPTAGGEPRDAKKETLPPKSKKASGKGQEKQSNADPLIRRLMANAELENAVAELNKTFFVVEDLGNKCRVCWLEADPDLGEKYQRLGAQAYDDFANRYNNVPVVVSFRQNGEPIYAGKGRAWLDHPKRRQYRTLNFSPGRDIGPDVFNLWKGFAYEPKPGDCSLYLNFIRDVICSGNPLVYGWVLSWLAHAVQRPWERGHTALVLRGQKGIGKNFFGDTFGALWGTHYISLVHSQHVVGRFNYHLRDKCVLFANEAFFAGSHEHENMLKTLITEEILPIEKKYVDVTQARNYLHLIIASNADWVVRASEDERRFVVLDVSDAHANDNPYFDAIERQLKGGGYEALLHCLRNRDIAHFNPRVAPHTEALYDNVSRSMSATEQAWYECLYSGRLPGRIRDDGTVELVIENFIRWAQKHNRRWELSEQGVGDLLGTNPKARKRTMGFSTKREKSKPRFKLIASLPEARRRWDTFRFPVNWPPAPEGQKPEEESWEGRSVEYEEAF
ncbi:MAG TPA: primase-helicase family protein [Candidatus Sulfotelmatobacter sp.]|nr:primase-helicase family protein [Candidatus Sulfotelmatobacter sp.]